MRFRWGDPKSCQIARGMLQFFSSITNESNFNEWLFFLKKKVSDDVNYAVLQLHEDPLKTTASNG